MRLVYSDVMAQHAAPSALSDGILLGAFDVHLKGANLDCTLPARFFHNYQKDGSVWAEVVPAGPWLAGAEVEVSSPGHLRPFPAVLGSLTGKQQGGSFSLSAEVLPLRVPIEAAPVKSLREVTFALLDYPISGNLIPICKPK